MVLIPKTYFVTTGFGESDVSELMSFDMALKNAKISDYNWVPVSSILPKNIVYDSSKSLPAKGSILFCVMSRAAVKNGSTVSVGIGTAMAKDDDGNRILGFVVEDCFYENNKLFLENKIKDQLKFMAKIRSLHLENPTTATITFSPKKQYGTAIAVVVFNHYEIK